MSLAPGSGKTHILYHLTAVAVLPKAFGGAQACVVIVDTDGKFSVTRLATQIRTVISGGRSSNTVSDIERVTLTALEHVHILRPQTLTSTTATIRSIPEYLFNAQEHHSFERKVAFVALDSLTSFYWQTKAENEHADLLSSTTAGMNAVQNSASYAQLAGATQYMAKLLQCPVIITAQYQGPPKRPWNTDAPPDAYSFRSPLPPPWGVLPVLRLVTLREAVRKIPAGVSLTEARREAPDRQAILDQGRFGCFVNEYGLDESIASRLRVLNATLAFFVREGGLTLSAG
jgi:DNA-repair protein XRCC2